MPTLADESKAVIQRLREAAEKPSAKMDLADVLGQRLADRSQFDDVIVDGETWFVGYGIEQDISGPRRHLSISHPNRISLPDIETTKLLMVEFGFDLDQPISPAISPYQKRGLTAHLMQKLL